MSDSDKPVTRGEIRTLIIALGKETKYAYDNNQFDTATDDAIDKVAGCLASVFGTGPGCQCGHPESDHDRGLRAVTCCHTFCSCEEFTEGT